MKRIVESDVVAIFELMEELKKTNSKVDYYKINDEIPEFSFDTQTKNNQSDFILTHETKYHSGDVGVFK